MTAEPMACPTKYQNNMNLKDIKDRCVEIGDCHIWQMSTTKSGYPQMTCAGSNCTLVRRFVFQLSGKKLKPRQPIITTCGDKLCVNPKHVRASTVQKVAKKAAKNGAFSSKTRGARIAASKRKVGKLNIEKARDIRASNESCTVQALRHGVNPSVINRIRSGHSWKEYSANPFDGLMRRAA